MKDLTSNEFIKEIIEEFNDSQIAKSGELFASLYEFDASTRQIFIVIEEHQEIYDFKELEKMLQKNIHSDILLGFIKNNKLFDNYLE